MGSYVVLLGGTGARCAEALCHMCMAGMSPAPQESLHILLADADDQHGNTSTARTLFSKYQSLQGMLQAREHGGPLARQALDVRFWDIGTGLFDQKETGQRREAQLSTLNEHPDPETQENSELLMKAFYTQSERSNYISSIGFFAHPNVGAAILRASILRDDDVAKERKEFANEYGVFRAKILDDLAGGRDVKIILIGSLFGGTGAACVPGIAEDITSRAAELSKAGCGNLTIGTTMMLPYFMFKQTSGGEDPGIDSARFQFAAKTALTYYAEQSTPFSNAYLLGLPSKPSIENTQRGGSKQNNSPIVIEWEAALACMHFFGSDSYGKSVAVYYKGYPVNHEFRWHLTWDSFSKPGISQFLGQYLRFALFYKHRLFPDIADMRRGREVKANFFLKYIEPFVANEGGTESEKGRKALDQMLSAMNGMVDAYLRWMDQSLSNSIVSQEMVNLQLLWDVAENKRAALSQKHVMDSLVTDGRRHQNYKDVHGGLAYASFGEPQTRRAGLSHLLQGVYELCH